MTELPDARPAAGQPASTVPTSSLPLLEEQNRAWHAGQRILVEAYLDRQPWLRSHPESLLDLIYNEIRLREEAGEVPEFEEYQQRFPELEELLSVQFEVHRALLQERALADVHLAEGARVSWDGLAPMPSVPGYELVEELGRGAMGVVYRARDLRLNRQVAIKMILVGALAGPRERARFETEARAVARLQHPHIVQIHEFGENEGLPFVCLEFVPGGSLAQRLAGKPLPARQAAELAERLARAVQHAHEQQIVHRDLKPANVLLAPSDARRGIRLGSDANAAYFEPKITDFGLAKLLDHEGEAQDAGSVPTGCPVGTPPYMAPEQIGSSESNPYYKAVGRGPATDIYALGALLYEMLTGRPPFLGASVYETLKQVISLDAVPPRRLQPGVPRDLETICLACLRKEPGRRYATALALAEDLHRFLEGRSIRQRRPTVWEPAVKWARRRPAAAALVLIGMATLFGAGAAGSYYVRHRQEWARERAHEHYRQFVRLRDQALFQETLLNAFAESPGERAAVETRTAAAAAREALALVGVTVENQGGPTLDSELTAPEQEDVRASCSELLLALAHATGQEGNESPEEQQRHLAAALRVLDRAREFGPSLRAYHLRRARLLAVGGETEQAAVERRAAEALPIGGAKDAFLTGMYEYQEGNTSAAIKSFHDALNREPDHFEARLFLAICLLNTGRPAEADIGLTACIGQRSDLAWPYLVRGLARAQQEQYAEAEADFASALERDDGEVVRYAVEANRGVLALTRKRPDEAITWFEQAVKVRPEGYEGHLLLARALLQRDRFDDATREIDRAVQLCPESPLVHRIRGGWYREKHDLNAALREFDKALAVEPAGSMARADDHIERGRVRHLQGRLADAVADYDAALKVRPDDAIAHYLRGQALEDLHQPREAEQAFSRALQARPSYGAAFRGRGQARVQQGLFAGAVEDYTQAALLERDASILLHRGWAYFFTDAWKLAERDFVEAIQLDARSCDARIGRGLARIMLGDYRAAVADAEEVLRLHGPDTPEMMHNLACLFALAAARVRSDAGESQRQVLEARYQGQALTALREAVLLVPGEQRAAFWREKMRPDTALDSIRSRAEFAALDRNVQDGSLRQESGSRP